MKRPHRKEPNSRSCPKAQHKPVFPGCQPASGHGMALYLLSKSVPKPNSKPRSHIADMLKNRDEKGANFTSFLFCISTSSVELALGTQQRN